MRILIPLSILLILNSAFAINYSEIDKKVQETINDVKNSPTNDHIYSSVIKFDEFINSLKPKSDIDIANVTQFQFMLGMLKGTDYSKDGCKATRKHLKEYYRPRYTMPETPAYKATGKILSAICGKVKNI